MTIHPQSQHVLELLAAGGTPMNQMAASEARAYYDEVLLENNPVTIDVAQSEDFDISGPHGPIGIRSYIPRGLDRAQPAAALVFYHGGGWVVGSVASRDQTCRMFIGYHAGATNPDGVRAHTISSANLAGVRLNGRAVPEAGISAAIAGHFGVPVIMVSGDDAAVAEARAVIGDIEGAVVKWNVSFHAARTLTPAAAYKVIGEKVTAALRRLTDFEPLVLETPVRLDVRFKNYRPSQLLALLPIVERTDARSIRFVGTDMIAVSKFLEFMISYEPGLRP